MRYRRAVEKLRELAGACNRVKDWPPEDPFLVSAYVFGDMLEGADPLKAVQVAVAVNLPPEEVPWGSSPHGTGWLADQLRLLLGTRLAEGAPRPGALPGTRALGGRRRLPGHPRRDSPAVAGGPAPVS